MSRQRITGFARANRRKRYRINSARLVLLGLVLLLGGELVLAALTSPWFSVRKVEIKGITRMTRDQVMKYVEIPDKANLFRLDTQQIASSLKREPLIKKVLVRKVLPGTVVVQITERTPDFVLQRAGKSYLIDSSGVPFSVVAQPAKNLPVIACERLGEITLGRRISSPSFRSAYNCLRLARQKKNFEARQISVDRNGDLCLNTREGLEVRLGQPVQLAEKLEQVDLAIAQIPVIRRDTEYIDVTCPQEPAFRPRRKF